MSLKWFNENALTAAVRNLRTAPAGFVYGYVPDIIQPARYAALVSVFPEPSGFTRVDKQSGGGRKRFYVGPSYFAGRDRGCLCMFRRHPIWRELFHEAGSPRVTELLSALTGTKLNTVCDFGIAWGGPGCVQEPHIDGSVRADDPNEVKSVVATIVYLNANPDGTGGTAVYLPDRTSVLLQAPHLKNGMFFFEQHPEAWHGFPEMPAGSERRVLSLSWSQEPTPIKAKGSLHCLGCRTFWRDVLRG